MLITGARNQHIFCSEKVVLALVNVLLKMPLQRAMHVWLPAPQGLRWRLWVLPLLGQNPPRFGQLFPKGRSKWGWPNNESSCPGMYMAPWTAALGNPTIASDQGNQIEWFGIYDSCENYKAYNISIWKYSLEFIKQSH